MAGGRFVELRCTTWFDGLTLRMDVEQVSLRDGRVAIEALAMGAAAWDVGDSDRFNDAVASWLGGREAAWEADPERIPDGHATVQWTKAIGKAVENAVGPEPLAEILVTDPPEGTRIVFRALDHHSARLPVEAFGWPVDDGALPLVATPGNRVSVIRVADRLRRDADLNPSLATRDPGWFRTLLLSPAGGARDEVLVKPALKSLEPLDGTNGAVEPVEFSSGSDELQQRVDLADLVAVCGHGEGHLGADAGNEARLDGRSLAKLAPGGPYAVALAMCGSAMSGQGERQASVALEVARTGVPLVIGFQGKRVMLDRMNPFLACLADRLATSIASEATGDEKTLSLKFWETAIHEARGKIPEGASAPVVYVNPALLHARHAGRTRSRRHRPVRSPESATSAVATLWHVPGQLICFEDGGRLLRVPLPVDTGSEVQVEGGAGEFGVRSSGRDALLTAADLEAVAETWPLPKGSGLTATFTAEVEDDEDQVARWACYSAELSGVIRAVSHLTGSAPSAEILEMLDDAVRDDWGAHDAAPRAIELETGRRVRRFAAWPPLAASPVHVREGSGAKLKALLERPPLAKELDRPWAKVTEALSQPANLLALARAQRASVSKADNTPPQIRNALQADVLVIPGAARIEAATGGDSCCWTGGSAKGRAADELFAARVE